LKKTLSRIYFKKRFMISVSLSRDSIPHCEFSTVQSLVFCMYVNNQAGLSSVIKSIAVFVICVFVSGCGLRFSSGFENTPFSPDLKTIMIESAVNNTTITGIETEITNQLRTEFALDKRLTPVRSGADVLLKTVIMEYDDTPSTYRADGKELTRIGTLKLNCFVERTQTKKNIWKKDLSASNTYNVTDTIAGTLTNRRQAISRMIKDLIPRIHQSLYNNF
jgi:hypothetical protein